MLENISSNRYSEEPPTFAEKTASQTTQKLLVCEDTDGSTFRKMSWQKSNVRLCSDGYSRNCSSDDAETHHYWETLFNINQRGIEAGEQLVASGFARGNYNYRIDSIAVNFVGTGTRDCEDSTMPSTCYSGGFIPYSLRHEGPYYVRNHMGNDYRAQLFTGNIEHARGLASERYITNPISSEDQQMLEQYTRTEFQGRPLDGNFVLRVWDEPGVDFESIEDVQLIIKYRYWTRFD